MPDLLNNPNGGEAFAKLVGQFADTITNNFRQPVPAQPEDQLKGPVGELLRATGELTGLEVGWRTEVHPEDVDGRPDIGITTDGLLTGLIELKRPGLGARPEGFKGRNRAQWERFKALPNLIYTDGSEWSLYRSGSLVQRTRISQDVSEEGAKGIAPDTLEALRELLRDFLYWDPIVPSTPEGLAAFLAPLARVLRDEVQKALARQASPLQTLAKEWGGLLFPEGDEAQFADAYAQTVTYALLLARLEGADSLRPLLAVDALQPKHGLLAEALQLLEAPSVRNELTMPIELLERAIGAVDSVKIGHSLETRGSTSTNNSLGAYDPKLRKARGVYFTPVEVVRAQVRVNRRATAHALQVGHWPSRTITLSFWTLPWGLAPIPLPYWTMRREAVARDRLGPGAVAGKATRGLADRLTRL